MPASNVCKLNLLQQVMAMWEEVHPYNAGHVVRLSQRADVASLQAAVREACALAGTGNLVLDHKKRHYQYAPSDSIVLREVPYGDSAYEALSRVVTEEINTPFPPEPHHPVRWLVLDDPKTDSHFLVAIYRHLAADSFSMRLLMRCVLNRYCQRPSPGADEPLQVLPPDYTRVMRHHYRRLGYLRTLLRAVRLYLRLRHVHRVPERVGGGEGTRCCVFAAPEGLIGRLTGICQSRQLSVGQAFLAALYAGMAEITPDRLRHHRRRGLAMAAPVDVRGEASEDLSRCFGVYLGQVVTIMDQGDTLAFGKLLRRVAGDLRVEKAEKRFVGPHWNLWIMVLLKRWFSLQGTRAWYRKVYPLSGCLSSVKLSAAWFGGAGDRILDYIRVSPTGPSLPLVLTPTTFRHRFNLAVTYRESSFTHPEVLKLIGAFLTKLELLARSGEVIPHYLSEHGA